MAGTFPIGYTQAEPSGKAGAVPWHLDVNTGSEHIARGIEALGEGFMRIAEAKRATDFSTKKREFEQMSFDAVNLYSATGDQQARETIKQDWIQKGDKILSTNDAFLQPEINKYKDEVMPHWGQTFANHELGIQTRQVKDAAQINIQKHLELGAVNEAAKEIQNLQHLNLISQAEAEQQINDLPITSAFTIAGKKLYDNPIGAQEDLTVMDKSKMDEVQLAHWDKLNDMARGQESYLTTQFNNSLTGEMLKYDTDKKDASGVETNNFADTLYKKIEGSGLRNTDKMKLNKEVLSWSKGEGLIDYERINALNTRVDQSIYTHQVDPTIEAEINTAAREGAFGPRNRGGSSRCNNLLHKARTVQYSIQKEAVKPVVSVYEVDNKRDPEKIHLFNVAMDKIVDQATKENWNTTKTLEEASAQAVFFRKQVGKEDRTAMLRIYEAGQVPVPWSQLPVEKKRSELMMLMTPTPQMLPAEWNADDIKAAKKIVGKSASITDEHIAKFEDYLDKEKRQHFTAVTRVIIKSDADYDVLAPGTVFVGPDGKRRRKP